MYKRTEYTMQWLKPCQNAPMHGHEWLFPFVPQHPHLYHPTRTIAYFLYHMRVILVCLIFFCSWKIPNMSASAVGGQPGT